MSEINQPSQTHQPTQGYTLTLRSGRRWSHGHMLRPDVIGSLSPSKLSETLRAYVQSTNHAAGDADAFDITGSPGDSLTLVGLPATSGMGAHMRRGSLIIHGDVADDLGASMSGGRIHVHGQARHRAGGPALGLYEHPLAMQPETSFPTAGLARLGMRGGSIVIHGSAGDYAGLRMRQGLLAITGHVGHSPAMRMVAGTLVTGKGDLDQPGLEMQRGTIVSLSSHACVHAGGRFDLVATLSSAGMLMIRLLLKELKLSGMKITDAMELAHWRVSSGDRSGISKGEIWQCADIT